MARNHLEIQFGLAHDCIRACVYADYIGRTKPSGDAWLSICDTLYADAILSWNNLFGGNPQPAHWKKWAERAPVPASSRLRPFDLSMIASYLKTTPELWAAYHQTLVDLRNQRLAHFDWKSGSDELPNLTWAMHSAFLYREWLVQLIRAYRTAGAKVNVTEQTGVEVLKFFEDQIAEICRTRPADE